MNMPAMSEVRSGKNRAPNGDRQLGPTAPNLPIDILLRALNWSNTKLLL